MSSILKALKKLEKNSHPDADIQSRQSRPQENIRKVTVGRLDKDVRSFRKIFFFVFTVMGVVIGVWYFFAQPALFTRHGIDYFFPADVNNGEGTKVAGKVSNAQKDKRVSNSAITITPAQTVRPSEVDASRTASSGNTVPDPDQTTNIRENLDLITTEEHTSPAARITLEASPKLSGEKGPGMSSLQANSNNKEHERTGPSAPERGDLLMVKKRTSIRRLDNSILRLQAITWSKNTEDRFALIDDHIVRVGESVKDFSITDIEEDYVVVQKGDVRWRLEFRFR